MKLRNELGERLFIGAFVGSKMTAEFRQVVLQYILFFHISCKGRWLPMKDLVLVRILHLALGGETVIQIINMLVVFIGTLREVLEQPSLFLEHQLEQEHILDLILITS